MSSLRRQFVYRLQQHWGNKIYWQYNVKAFLFIISNLTSMTKSMTNWYNVRCARVKIIEIIERACFINSLCNIMKVFRSFLSRLMLSIDDEIRIPPFFPSCSIAQFSTARTRFHHGEELMPLTFPAMASLTVRVRAACRDYCSFMALRQNDGATRFSPVNRTTAFHSFPRHVCPSIRQYLWVTRSHGNSGGLYCSRIAVAVA